MSLSPIPAMLATLVDKPFDSDEYVYEIKFDGFRALADIENKQVLLYSRNLKSFNEKFPAIVKELSQVKEDVIFDGEVIAYGKRGEVSFEALQQSGEVPTRLEYVIFDLLHYKGKSLIGEPLIKRKVLLEKLLSKYPSLTYSSHVEEKGRDFFRQAVKHKMEGIIAKRKDAPYTPGKRSDAWLKIKCNKMDEGIIIGFTEPRGSRKRFGALVLAQYRGDDELTFIGHTGTGFSDKGIEDLYKKLKPLVVKKPPIKEKIAINAPITWVRPRLTAQLKFTEWTRGGAMRHPVFLGLREDKETKAVKREKEFKTESII